MSPKRRVTASASAASPQPSSKRIKNIPTTSTTKNNNTSTAGLYLLKSEPHEFSIHHLRDSPAGAAPWDGVRNAQAGLDTTCHNVILCRQNIHSIY
jgi:hypothetical protein